ncbi:MAG: hypothetical protein HQL51_05855 [Magnetococcales bacterium]|nr:hypothetical protein [Magnetococcales bacterium]
MSDEQTQRWNPEPKVKMAGLYEKISAKGTRYFVGYLGGVKLLMLPDHKAAADKPGWNLFAVERAPFPGAAGASGADRGRRESSPGGRNPPSLGRGDDAPLGADESTPF